MKKILGLDLGSSSIGWAFIEEEKEKTVIKRLGVRVIPYSGDEKDQFSKGQAITVNKNRTLKRTARKTNHRYKLRKKALIEVLTQNGMMPSVEMLLMTSAEKLYELRANGVTDKLELPEIGRILFHLNQKRGYRSSRSGNTEEESGKKLSDYLSDLKDRKEMLEKENLTIGQYFAREFKANPFFQTRKKVFPRECYIDEFNRIWKKQQQFYPKILTEEFKLQLRDEIIYYQRRLKSQKGLVGECQFELHHKVTPRSSPLFQLGKIWESINAITLTNKYNASYSLSIDQKRAIFNHLDHTEKLNQTDLFKILGIKRTDGWHADELVKKAGIQGNVTKTALRKCFSNLGLDPSSPLLSFDIFKTESAVDKETGEIVETIVVDPHFEKQPLYQLWHLLYSVDSPESLIKTLVEKFQFTQDQAETLSKLDFKKTGFGNKSAKAIRKILPFLAQGMVYSDACAAIGYNHSGSLTTEENRSRVLQDKLEHYKKNSLRQPVVEKILNQLVNLVNSIVEDPSLGKPDEIRVELARDLRQSRKERNNTYSQNIQKDKYHKEISTRIESEFPGVKITRRLIEKYKLFEQQDATCLYSGRKLELSQVLRGESVDIDHIIPQSKLFDDSFQNKVLVLRAENEKKDNSTAHDYMETKSEEEFNQYIERVDQLYANKKISKSKRDKLLMPEKDIPDDFINRQLNETRFVSKEAMRLLKNICYDVHATSGSVTEFLRTQWGLNEVLQQINWHKYEIAGKTENGKIIGWSKRDDHRHHAIDALVVASTKQSIIQKLNRLNSSATREDFLQTIQGKTEQGWQARCSLLEEYVRLIRPYNTKDVKDAVEQILVSLKPGKKVATLGKNKMKSNIPTPIQKTFTPRGQLHKEQVYGKIRRYAETKTPLNGRFDRMELIANPVEKELVKARLAQYGNDPKKAFKDLEKDPIWTSPARTKALTQVTLWEEVFVYKYTLNQNFKEKDIDSIIDAGIRKKVQKRFTERTGQKDHPLKNLEKDPIWLNEEKKIPITSVRCSTGLKDLVPLHFVKNGNTYPNARAPKDSIPADFVSTRNNHHIAIYQTPDGNLEEIALTLWEAVERKKYGLPVVIREPAKVWDEVLLSGLDNQEILKALPKADWSFITSLQQNELFVFRMIKDELTNALRNNDFEAISPNLYRVQKIAESYYVFRHHLETKLEKDNNEAKEYISLGKMIRIASLQAFKNSSPIKVRINALGNIELIDT
jgi:CRISPR-associated endonuclease Csn1